MKFKFRANKFVVPLLEKGKMIDLACGDGELIEVARKKGIEVTGLDIKKSKYTNIVHNLEKPLPLKKDEFFQVTCVDSLEHVKNVSQVLDEGRRILKKKGTFIFTIPNSKFYHRHAKNHVSYFTYKYARQLIKNSQMKLEKEVFFYFVPGFKIIVRVPFHWMDSHFIFKLRK